MNAVRDSVGAKGVRSIAIYGRTGVGKTVVSLNLAVALSRAGHRVLLAGCGCKPDPAVPLRGDIPAPTLLGLLRECPSASPVDAVRQGFAGVFRIETGYTDAVNSRLSTASAIQRIHESGLFEELNLDYVIYNVQGDESGGNFTVPIRSGPFRKIFTVMSAELNSVRTTNSLFDLIRKYSRQGGARAGGIIANFIDMPYSRTLIDDYAARTAMNVLTYIPRISLLENPEPREKSIFETAPDSLTAEAFANLAMKIATFGESRVPYPLVPDDIWKFSTKWNTRFIEMETGEGAGGCI